MLNGLYERNVYVVLGISINLLVQWFHEALFQLHFLFKSAPKNTHFVPRVGHIFHHIQMIVVYIYIVLWRMLLLLNGVMGLMVIVVVIIMICMIFSGRHSFVVWIIVSSKKIQILEKYRLILMRERFSLDFLFGQFYFLGNFWERARELRCDFHSFLNWFQINSYWLVSNWNFHQFKQNDAI